MTSHLPYDRSKRVGDEIRRLVSETIITEISDPRLKGVHITVVRMTKDLRIARIYYHMLDGTDALRGRASEGFRSAAGFLRRKIGTELSLKFTPEVEFFYDESVDISERIDELIAGAKGGE